jgi:hypothetical protein
MTRTPSAGAHATPFGVLDGHLLFLAIGNGRTGLFRTDGTNVKLIDDSLTIGTTSNSLYFSSVKVAQLGDE